MDLGRHIDDPTFQNLLPFLDPGLPSAHRIALLGIARGYTLGQLAHLPGLANPTRLRKVLSELESTGRIAASGLTYDAIPGPIPDDATIAGLRAQKKVGATLELLLDPAGGLYARGLAGMAAALGAGLGACLDRALHKVDALAATDREFARRSRLSRLHYVERNVPRELVRETPDGPRPLPAPVDFLDRTVRELTRGLRGPVRDQREREIKALYTALIGLGETVFPHWWQILRGLERHRLKPEALWAAWRGRLESYLLLRRITLGPALRYRELEPHLLRVRYPVPQCGYGPWVDRELRLWKRFRVRYAPALGPLTKDLWLRTHEQVARELSEEYPGAEPGRIGRSLYEERLPLVAKRLSGLSPDVLADLAEGRRTPEVMAARQRAEQEVNDRLQRDVVRRAVRYLAAAGRKAGARHTSDSLLAVHHPVDLSDVSPKNWAPRLLYAVARREAGEPVSEDELATLEQQALKWKTRGGKRHRHRTLVERVVSGLDYQFAVERVIVGPSERFPVERVEQHVGRALEAVARDSLTREEDAAARAAVLHYLKNRVCVDVVVSLGTEQRSTIADACRLTGHPEVATRVFGLVERVRLPEEETEANPPAEPKQRYLGTKNLRRANRFRRPPVTGLRMAG